MKGCILYGRVAFSVKEKNSPAIQRKFGDQPRRKLKD
jgi:hypothetical protein